jgi:selenocysteine lyase/cysteine desulfurase
MSQRLIEGLQRHRSLTVYGNLDLEKLGQRVPTFSFTHSEIRAPQLADMLGKRGLFVWHGNYYALNLSEHLGQEPHGMVRVGAVHYNTPEEIDWLIDVLDEIE